MQTERTQVLIAGGGIIGSSIACALVERGVRDVCVVDPDLAGRYASSELNAGGARATWWQRVNIETCRDTLAFFRAHGEEFGFRPWGYLWLYDDRERFARALERRALQTHLGLEIEVLGGRDLPARFPVLDRGLDSLAGATFSPGDGLLNPNAVRRWYRERAEAGGARFLDRHWLEGVELAERTPGVRSVEQVNLVELRKLGHDEDTALLEGLLTRQRVPPEVELDHPSIRPEILVNALGAWSPLLDAKLGARSFAEPVRRQLSLFDVRRSDVAPGVDLARLGMIVDASNVYFHSEGPYVLAGYSNPDEPPGYAFHSDGDAFFEAQIWPRLAQRASSFERCGHVRSWAGLYSVTPDCSGIVGRVAGVANAIDAHSFTGRGVMQSFAIGRGVAELIARGRFESLDLTPLSPARFAAERERWLVEDLHI